MGVDKVYIPHRIRERLRELCRDSAGKETGGILTCSGGAVSGVTGPGPNARATRKSLVWDGEYIAAALGHAMTCRAHGKTYARFLGRWHKHCIPAVHPSDADVSSALVFAQLAGDETVELIIGCDAKDRPVKVGAYRVRDGAMHRVECDPEWL